MILQALVRYYERMAASSDVDVAPPGFEVRKVHFCLVLSENGDLIRIEDIRRTGGKRPEALNLVVPSCGTRTSVKPFFLCDNAQYLLGLPNLGKIEPKKDPEKEIQRLTALALSCLEEARKLHSSLLEKSDDPGLAAVVSYLNKLEFNRLDLVEKYFEKPEEIYTTNFVFRLDGENRFLHDRAFLQSLWSQNRPASGTAGYCLVSGQKTNIARLHPLFKEILGTKPTGGSLVGFNQDSFESYGKSQSYNAPTSEMAVFQYSTALNKLLERGSSRRVQIGDATTVFWSETPQDFEWFFGQVLDPKDDDDTKEKLGRFLQAASDGRMFNQEAWNPEEKFFVLGLSPNAARLSVRFWYAGTIGEMRSRLEQHFSDMKVERAPDSPEFPSMWRLLRELAVEQKDKNIPKQLAGEFTRAILAGSLYPSSLLTQILVRIRADHRINDLRVGLIKAYLLRKDRIHQNHEWEVTMSLDTESKNIPYRLGRLFAVLEKVQSDAIHNANATIKDRFYGSASATPKVVFPQLIRMAQHHIRKSDWGVGREIQMQEILSEIDEFPSHLALDEQGMFAIGYYHQRADLFKPKNKANKEGN